MSWFRHLLHLDDDPVVTDRERAEVAALRAVTAKASARANVQASEARRLERYFHEESERNHIAERLLAAIRRERG